MPFYEYECSNCKFYVEALQKISDPPIRKCPSCKKQTMKRLVSAPVFRLKGGGWYETDFKSEQEGKRNLAAAEEAPPEPKADDAKKDKDKPETKAEAKPEPKAEAKTAAKKPVAKSKAPTKAPVKAKPKVKAKAAKKKSRR
jgi:putative FmdB family regulatory protein